MLLPLLLALAVPAPDAGQAVVVTTASWLATTGRLQRYEKLDGKWSAVGEAVDVVVGEGGMGWGVGLHEFASGPGEPKKMEGDGRAPAGVFSLVRVLGKGGVPKTAMPNAAVKEGDVCVDDSRSSSYNHVLVGEAPRPYPFESAEKMWRRDALYDLVVVVDHNHVDGTMRKDVEGGGDAFTIVSSAVKGRGSCIFLHPWRRPNSPTVGCTAMPAPTLVDVVAWLDPAKKPVLVQLPRDIYARVRDPWALP